MPGFGDLERIATGHGIGIALLLCAIPFLAAVIVALYRENRRLYLRIETLLDARFEATERKRTRRRRVDRQTHTANSRTVAGDAVQEDQAPPAE
jgi:hypothetical protein